jgi:hypothetical protein
MSDIKLYGETAEEKLLREKQQCREIVKEILDFGISERQKYQLIKLIAENLENYFHMKKVIEIIDELETTDIGDILNAKEESLSKFTTGEDNER